MFGGTWRVNMLVNLPAVRGVVWKPGWIASRHLYCPLRWADGSGPGFQTCWNLKDLCEEAESETEKNIWKTKTKQRQQGNPMESDGIRNSNEIPARRKRVECTDAQQKDDPMAISKYLRS